jgi:hypothetical protein
MSAAEHDGWADHVNKERYASDAAYRSEVDKGRHRFAEFINVREDPIAVSYLAEFNARWIAQEAARRVANGARLSTN